MRNLSFVKFLIIVSLVCVSYSSWGQKWPFELWHEGKIVLEEGDTLTGKLKYDLQQDLVQFVDREHPAVAFTARKVVFFQIFDETVRRYRNFFTLPYASTPGYKTPIFFELLAEGKMTLLAREFLEYRNQTSMYMTYSRLVLSHRYFFLKEDGELEEFSGSKNDLLDRMGKDAEDVDKYIRQNRLRMDDKYDFAQAIDYYNSLFRK